MRQLFFLFCNVFLIIFCAAASKPVNAGPEEDYERLFRQLAESEWHDCWRPKIPACMQDFGTFRSDVAIDNCVGRIKEFKLEIEGPYQQCLLDWVGQVTENSGWFTRWKIDEVEYRADEEYFTAEQGYHDTLADWIDWSEDTGNPEITNKLYRIFDIGK